MLLPTKKLNGAFRSFVQKVAASTVTKRIHSHAVPDGHMAWNFMLPGRTNAARTTSSGNCRDRAAARKATKRCHRSLSLSEGERYSYCVRALSAQMRSFAKNLLCLLIPNDARGESGIVTHCLMSSFQASPFALSFVPTVSKTKDRCSKQQLLVSQ